MRPSQGPRPNDRHTHNPLGQKLLHVVMAGDEQGHHRQAGHEHLCGLSSVLLHSGFRTEVSRAHFTDRGGDKIQRGSCHSLGRSPWLGHCRAEFKTRGPGRGSPLSAQHPPCPQSGSWGGGAHLPRGLRLPPQLSLGSSGRGMIPGCSPLPPEEGTRMRESSGKYPVTFLRENNGRFGGMAIFFRRL